MITWLQALIEKRGKWLFIVLLAVVIVAFVPYISPTGSSSLDFFTEESQRGRDKYFGFDWYDPNDQRWLQSQAAVSGALGTSPAPNREAWLETLRQVYSGQLEQSQFQARQVRLAMEAKIALLQIGATWNLLPLSAEHQSSFQENTSSKNLIAEEFRDFLASRIDERSGIAQNGEIDSAKYEQTVQSMASGLNIKANQVQAILFEDFRAEQVDASLRAAGFALHLEGELDLRARDLLWNYEAVTLDAETFEPKPLPFASILFRGVPENNATLTLSYDNSSKIITFKDPLPKKPAEGEVAIGPGDSEKAKLLATRDNLAAALRQTGLSFVLAAWEDNASVNTCGLNLSLPDDGVPFEMPRVSSTSEAFSISNELENELAAYYEDRRGDEIFMKPARTGVSAFEFQYSVHLKEPTAPTEAELRAYFDLHPGEFSRPAKQAPAPSPDSNKSIQPEITSPDSDGRKGPRGRPSVRKSRVPKKEKVEEKPVAPEPEPLPEPGPVAEPAPEKPSPAVQPVTPPPPPPSLDANATGGSDANATTAASQPKEPPPPVTFEEVRKQVLERVLEEKRADLETEARDLAEQQAEDFISELHGLSRKFTEKGIDSLKIRNDRSIGELVDRFQPGDRRMAAFSEGEIDSTSKIVGLPGDALSDMIELPAHRFFSEATYETDKGFAVILLDARLPAAQQDLEKVDFRVLLREFRTERKQDAFQAHGEDIAKSLREELPT
ncbi:MAG: hypothetical protein AAEJ57_01945, partial [Opitutales bacterium]